MDDLETMTDGSVAGDIINSKITGRDSPYMQEVKGGRQMELKINIINNLEELGI
jgi:hypothetical protein